MRVGLAGSVSSVPSVSERVRALDAMNAVVPGDLRGFLETSLLTVGGATITTGSVLLGVVVVVVAIVFANVLAFFVKRLVRSRGGSQGAQFAIAKIVRYAGIGLGVLEAVNAMGMRLDALLAASTVLAVGIGFGLQNIAQNFISGLILLVEQPVRHGDFIRVDNVLGTVDDIGLRATTVVTRDEVTIVVPNSALISGQVVNHSRPTTSLRIQITVGVAYGTDMQRVVDALLAVARSDEGVLPEPAPEVRLEDFGESSLVMALFCWIPNAREDLRTSSALRFAIEKRFRADGIEMPFPQRDVRVKMLSP
jgi:small-conductance mechanosensitive channel